MTRKLDFLHGTTLCLDFRYEHVCRLTSNHRKHCQITKLQQFPEGIGFKHDSREDNAPAVVVNTTRCFPLVGLIASRFELPQCGQQAEVSLLAEGTATLKSPHFAKYNRSALQLRAAESLGFSSPSIVYRKYNSLN